MKQFDVPFQYTSSFIAKVKQIQSEKDPRKKDYSPTLLPFKNLDILIPRHFGFCYGVSAAVEKSYQILTDNPDKNIYLLSEMIHNPEVNADLESMGLRFIQDTNGNQLIPWSNLKATDIIIIPAFGSSLEVNKKIKEIGISTESYDTTCPFVEKVWNKSKELSVLNCTLIIHGKFEHEETRATFSRAKKNGPAVVISDLNEAKQLGVFLAGGGNENDWNKTFKNKASEGFNFKNDLSKIGVVNQTTMLASETEKIAEYLKSIATKKWGTNSIDEHFVSARDTLCYATNDNQKATIELAKETADFAIVIGGYNSSNTSHLAELLSENYPTYYIQSASNIEVNGIEHFDITSKKLKFSTLNFSAKNYRIVISSGASCPDSVMESVILKLLSFQGENIELEMILDKLKQDGF